MAWSDAVITTKGLDLLADLIAGEELTLNSAVAGTGTVAPTALITSTELDSPLTDVPVYIASVKDLAEGSGKQIKLQIRNTGVTEARRMNQLGIFAQVNGESVLFAIMQDDIGENIPTESEYLDFMIEFTAAIALSQTDGITVVVDAKAYMTYGDVEEMIKSYVSNPNHLINPNYRINQRGQTEYSEHNKYTVDGWKINHGTVGVITPMNGYIHAVISPSTGNPGLVHKFEDISRFAGKTVTVSAKIRSDTPKMALRIWLSTISSGAGSRLKYHSGNGEWETITNTVTLPEDINNMTVETDVIEAAELDSDKYFDVEWVKLEFGSVATPFIPPDPATELVKCQRYYQVRSTGDIDPVDLRPSMATITDVRERSDGNYEYIAEL